MSIALLALAVVATLALTVTTLLGQLGGSGPAWMRQHVLFGLSATFLLVMAHSFILFFLIATGAELKELEKRKGWGDSFRRRSVAMKSRVFPVTTLALLVVIANFIVGGAAHTRVLPGWVHGVVAWATVVLCLVTLRREYGVLGDNNRLIAEAASRGEDRGPSGSEDTANSRA
jgi:sterol desaturase/sphingolipid hydroxylase (fatty acid hydroxylase superfamily)